MCIRDRVDVMVQQYIREYLERRYPLVQFLSEEKTNDEIDRSAPVWVLDPVDGTTNLIHDYHASVISLALMEEGRMILAFVYNPYSREPVSYTHLDVYKRQIVGWFLN